VGTTFCYTLTNGVVFSRLRSGQDHVLEALPPLLEAISRLAESQAGLPLPR
jgi:hypothetical protein